MRKSNELFIIRQILLEMFYCIHLSHDVSAETKDRISRLLLKLPGVQK